MDMKISKSGGSLKISNDVIVKIAELAATEIKGVAVDDDHLATDIPLVPTSIVSKLVSPIRVRISGDTAEIDANIIVTQGNKAVTVAQAVQESIKSAVQTMAGITVSKVNIRIAGIRTIKAGA